MMGSGRSWCRARSRARRISARPTVMMPRVSSSIVPEITRRTKAQAIAELREENLLGVAIAAEALIVDENEPYVTGREYLSDFELSYIGEDGAIHFNSPGLFHDYDSWTTWILPEKFEGQTYCHLATVEYMKAVAKGEIKPGTLITTTDDAPVTPN